MQALIPDDIPDQGASLCGNYRPDGEGVVVALRRDGTTRARSARRRDEVCAGKLSVAALGTMIDIIRTAKNDVTRPDLTCCDFFLLNHPLISWISTRML